MWTDVWFDELEPVEKLLFIYLITNQKTNLLGIYDHTPRRISIDTRIPEKEVKEMLLKFEENGKIYFTDGWIWIVNWIKNQKWNPKMVRSIEIRFSELEDPVKQLLRTKNESGFIQLQDSINSLLIAYPLTTSKDVKSKEVKNETFKELKKETCKIGITRFHEILKNEKYLQELELKGFIQYEVKRDIDRFCRLSSDKEFESEDHLKNTFLNFMNIKNMVDYRVAPRKYERILQKVYTYDDYLEKLINEYGVSLENWTVKFADNWEAWMKANNPRIENEGHAINMLREYLELKFKN
ncbi:hypothetical protein [Algoriphagus ratkowskyi]|nr:hypothetical protein [Algoriphagus ratkowskyi]TXD78026.1 hypothetical protein ESW18_08225 [Algoriphagus ratkowskyi]